MPELFGRAIGHEEMQKMPSRTRQKRADETRKQILDAALQVISKKGYSSATVDEIVRTAGVSKGLAYYYFHSKADMATSILDEGIDNLTNQFETIVSESATPDIVLQRMMGVFASAVFDNREFASFFVSELWREGRAWSHDMRTNMNRLISLIEGQIRSGQEQGIVRTSVDPTFATVSIVGMVLTTLMFYIGEENLIQESDVQSHDLTLDRDEFVQYVCDFIRHATSETAFLEDRAGIKPAPHSV
jgi:AcrR family transcriptional regulator